MNLLGICGKAGAGKDTLADIMVREHGYVKRSFAGPLYEEAAAAFNVSVEWLADRTRKEIPQPDLALWRTGSYAAGTFAATMQQLGHDSTAPRSPRQILQWWGTEYRRTQSDTYWLERMALFVKAAHDVGAAGVVIPDVRFDNEAKWVTDNGGSIIQIIRPGVAAVAAHASEAGVPIEFVRQQVVNDGPIFRLNDVAIIASRWTSTHTEKEMAP